MDSRNYIYTKIEETFMSTYTIKTEQIASNIISNDNKKEQFNSLEDDCIDNAVNDYNFTFRQNKPNMS
jgi:hypothetical protein